VVGRVVVRSTTPTTTRLSEVITMVKKVEEKKFNAETLKILGKYREFQIDTYRAWGDQERLDRLITDDLKNKFLKANHLFSEAMLSRDDMQMRKMVEMMNRAYEALIVDIQQQGYKPLEPHIRCFNWEGSFGMSPIWTLKYLELCSFTKRKVISSLLVCKSCLEQYQRS
jgi:hypothetical protein